MKNTIQVVEYARALTFEKLPDAVIQAAKVLMLDTLGTLFAAWPSRHPAPRIVGDYVKEMEGKPECTVFGREFKAPAVYAALAAGVLDSIEGNSLNPQLNKFSLSRFSVKNIASRTHVLESHLLLGSLWEI